MSKSGREETSNVEFKEESENKCLIDALVAMVCKSLHNLRTGLKQNKKPVSQLLVLYRKEQT